jgi:CRISPR-associated protein Cas5d
VINVPYSPIIRPVTLRVWAPRACFARPDCPTERVSYLMPTPAAARGVLEAILWKPQFYWKVHSIAMLKPLAYFQETRNEVNRRASRESLETPLQADQCRLQRHTLGLRDVDYLIVAEPVPVPWTTKLVLKYVNQFEQRVARGQCFARPYLGSREWSCDFGPPRGDERPVALSMDLGRMHFDWRFAKDGATFRDMRNNNPATPIWFDARLLQGVMTVPTELYERGGGCRGSERRQPGKA